MSSRRVTPALQPHARHVLIRLGWWWRRRRSAGLNGRSSRRSILTVDQPAEAGDAAPMPPRERDEEAREDTTRFMTPRVCRSIDHTSRTRPPHQPTSCKRTQLQRAFMRHSRSRTTVHGVAATSSTPSANQHGKIRATAEDSDESVLQPARSGTTHESQPRSSAHLCDPAHWRCKPMSLRLTVTTRLL